MRGARVKHESTVRQVPAYDVPSAPPSPSKYSQREGDAARAFYPRARHPYNPSTPTRKARRPVTTATASDYTLPTIGGRHHFLLRRLHSLTGIVFGGYLVVHLLVNATIAQLGTVYQVQVTKI